jgi:anthranilate phosphoribosyltransferase
MIKEALAMVIARQDLPEQMAAGAMEAIMTGAATNAQIGSFLTALRMKGESPTEVAAFAAVMRVHAVQFRVRGGQGRLVDTCGTGGDRAGTFNISTAAAIVAAGAGVRIVKHGNRSASGRCGSADVLEELGVNLAMTPAQEQATLEQAGIVFLFAQAHHPAMKHVAAARKEIGIRTVFNILGPLTNPAGADAQLLGVPEPALLDLLPPVLQALGVDHAMIVCGGGLDEISTTTATEVVEVKGTKILRYTLTPEQFGIPPGDLAELQGEDVHTSAAIIRGILDGEEGPCREITLLNAAAAIYLGGRAVDLSEGVRLAAASIDSGAAAVALRTLISASRGEA